MFKETFTTKDGVMFTKKIEEVNAPPSSDKKTKQRFDIENQVFDIHDSLADTTKWVSLLSSMVARIYSVLPEEQKANIPAQDRQMIEYSINKFMNSTTRADVQFEQEGIAMVDKIFDRQNTLANIIK